MGPAGVPVSSLAAKRRAVGPAAHPLDRKPEMSDRLNELAANHRWSWHLPTRELLDTLLRVGFDYGRAHLPDFILQRQRELGLAEG